MAVDLRVNRQMRVTGSYSPGGRGLGVRHDAQTSSSASDGASRKKLRHDDAIQSVSRRGRAVRPGNRLRAHRKEPASGEKCELQRQHEGRTTGSNITRSARGEESRSRERVSASERARLYRTGMIGFAQEKVSQSKALAPASR